nr:uncharacterized protein LOC129447634 [Misgurnus anguillicaudatus]
MAYSTQTLAKGCFGKIYMEKYKDSCAAMKRVPVSLLSRSDLERECKVYEKARHPNVVKLLGKPLLKDSKWHIPMEFIFGEDLETTIFKSASSKIQLNPAVRATIITGMCEGLLHLHSKDIVHQDLKPDNIMVEHETHRAVIIDMGLAKFLKNGLSSAQNMGNEAYSPPEILQMGEVRDKRSDVWAMGKIIAELCVRVRLPTQYVSETKIQETLKDHAYCKVVARMVETNPASRATMAGVISDIRRTGIVSKMDSKPGDTVTQKKETRGSAPAAVIPDVKKAAPQTDIKPRDVIPQRNDIRGKVPAPVIPDIRKPASPLKMDVRPRDVPVPQRNEMMGNPRWGQQVSASPKMDFKTSPLPNYRHTPPQNREMGKAPFVQMKGPNLNDKMSLMSFPCPLPETGKVIQRRFNERKEQIEYKEINTEGGRITKYEKVKMSKHP